MRDQDLDSVTPSFARPTLGIIEGGKGRRASGRFPLPTIAVASGKGGVGKTSLAVNLALALSDAGTLPLLIDGDLGLGKVDIFLGAEPRNNLAHVLDGTCAMADAALLGPNGIRFLAASCGLDGLAVLDGETRQRLIDELSVFAGSLDLALVDLPTGIGPNSVDLARRADTLILVVTPEPAAITDAYAFMRLAADRGGPAPVIVVNRARSPREADAVYRDLRHTARLRLGVTPSYLGSVPEDPAVHRAGRERRPFLLASPAAPASLAMRALVRRLRLETARTGWARRSGEPTEPSPLPWSPGNPDRPGAAA